MADTTAAPALLSRLLLNFPQKLLVSGLLAYATYITVTCPCDRLLSCHWPHFLGALGGAVALAFLFASDL